MDVDAKSAVLYAVFSQGFFNEIDHHEHSTTRNILPMRRSPDNAPKISLVSRLSSQNLTSSSFLATLCHPSRALELLFGTSSTWLLVAKKSVWSKATGKRHFPLAKFRSVCWRHWFSTRVESHRNKQFRCTHGQTERQTDKQKDRKTRRAR